MELQLWHIFDFLMIIMVIISLIWSCIKSTFIGEILCLGLTIALPYFIHTPIALLVSYLCILILGFLSASFLGKFLNGFMGFLVPLPVQFILTGILGGIRTFLLFSLIFYTLLNFSFLKPLRLDLEKRTKLGSLMLNCATLIVSQEFSKKILGQNEHLDPKKQTKMSNP